MPHLCFVAPTAFPILSGDEDIQLVGGAELQQVIVARCLAERGYTVSMICMNFGQDDQVEIDGITVFRAFRPDEGIPVLRFWWPRLTSIWDCMKRADADIYYQRTAGMLTGVVAAFCERHGRKSIFAAAHNSDLAKNAAMIRYSRDRWLYEYGVKHVDRVLVQNTEQAKLCRQNFGRESTLIPNCYQTPSPRSSEPRREILWVSTIRSFKRPGLFLDIAQALPAYRFRMVGGPASDEPRLFESIRSRAAQLANVAFIGFVPYSKIDGHFDGSTLFVNTSESEGFPNTFLQAWARSIPTISFFDCGARVDGKVLGQQVGSLAAMIAAIDRLMKNECERLSEGAMCLEYVARNHSPKRILDLYDRVVRELLESETKD